jgi:uncharacterized protein (DUF2384 family)
MRHCKPQAAAKRFSTRTKKTQDRSPFTRSPGIATVQTVGEFESAVSAGLPKRSLERLSARLYGDRKIASTYKFKVVPQATWKRRIKRLSVDESERTERLARVLAHAEYVWDGCVWGGTLKLEQLNGKSEEPVGMFV